MVHNLTNSSKGDILIVDDKPDNLRLLSTMLSASGYEVRKSRDGQMAVNSALMAPPDLILLDIKMPQMDGYKVCQLLKASEITKDIPIIFISALGDTEDKIKGFNIGAVDYITKPFQAEEVLARVQNHLSLRFLQKQLIEKNYQLEQLNQQLTRSNRELEEFAYVVSHDLQQPLQSITGFAKIILLKHQEPELNEYINRIINAGSRMERLIKDLLTYAKVSSKDRECQPINSQIILEQVLSNLEKVIIEKNVIIIYKSLPIVMANEVQLLQLLQNLISNAIKFVQPSSIPEIKISATQKEKEWLFAVSDNGIGIKPEDKERIFAIFQRLHSSEKYPGTGIGLAICKKIIDFHRGRIWVESEYGVGTTFYFTLPSAN